MVLVQTKKINLGLIVFCIFLSVFVLVLTFTTYATSEPTAVYTVYLDGIDTGESYQNTVKHGDEYSKEISTMASGVDVTCTNGQIPNISGPYNNIVTIYINQVTSNTSCEVQWWDY